jgi:pimeloyl-ACP methyl ester carboxylesterase
MATPSPLVVLSGWRATPALSHALAREMRKRLGDRPVAPVSFMTTSSIESAADRLVRAVDERFPTDDAERTAEVDIVGVSMGGLVARLAAAVGAGGRRLRIGTLFTLSTPHRGAKLAETITLDRAARQMKPGSAFLRALDAHERDYELVCYARLGDRWVGATNTAPPGMDPIWVEPPRMTLSHLLVSRDPRILDDIAARLGGEAPLLGPPSPAPRD